jgi:hypothetical protein
MPSARALAPRMRSDWRRADSVRPSAGRAVHAAGRVRDARHEPAQPVERIVQRGRRRIGDLGADGRAHRQVAAGDLLQVLAQRLHCVHVALVVAPHRVEAPRRRLAPSPLVDQVEQRGEQQRDRERRDDAVDGIEQPLRVGVDCERGVLRAGEALAGSEHRDDRVLGGREVRRQRLERARRRLIARAGAQLGEPRPELVDVLAQKEFDLGLDVIGGHQVLRAARHALREQHQAARGRDVRRRRAALELEVLHALGALEQLRIGARHVLGGARKRDEQLLVPQQRGRVLLGTRPVGGERRQCGRARGVAPQPSERGGESVAARLDLRKGLGVAVQAA